ncbi:hypothetical protein ACHAXT_008486 [Thalassiosira profunda]
MQTLDRSTQVLSGAVGNLYRQIHRLVGEIRERFQAVEGRVGSLEDRQRHEIQQLRGELGQVTKELGEVKAGASDAERRERELRGDLGRVTKELGEVKAEVKAGATAAERRERELKGQLDGMMVQLKALQAQQLLQGVIRQAAESRESGTTFHFDAPVQVGITSFDETKIDYVMSQAACSRIQAVAALGENEGDMLVAVASLQV